MSTDNIKKRLATYYKARSECEKARAASNKAWDAREKFRATLCGAIRENYGSNAVISFEAGELYINGEKYEEENDGA